MYTYCITDSSTLHQRFHSLPTLCHRLRRVSAVTVIVHSCGSTILILAYWPRGDSAASSLFGGMPGGYGLGAHHLPSAYAILGRGGSAPGFGGHTPASAPPPPPYSHSSLGTLSVAASQAASLGKSIFLISPLLSPLRLVLLREACFC